MIGGWGRCGSTLVDMMLGQLPGFVSAGEVRELWLRGILENRPCGCGVPFRSCPFWTKVGDEAFPGNLGYNKQLQTFMDEGGHVYACRFSAAALYGMREIDMMEGVKPINPLDVLDSVLTARRAGALIMQTWTV